MVKIRNGFLENTHIIFACKSGKCIEGEFGQEMYIYHGVIVQNFILTENDYIFTTYEYYWFIHKTSQSKIWIKHY